MIEVQVKGILYKDVEVTISGHANYAEAGKDIVCAAMSLLWYNFYNSLYELTNRDTTKLDSNSPEYRYMRIFKFDNNSTLLLQSFILGCESLQEQYPDNVKVTIFFWLIGD
ncbi:MAG: ribosomal-processing cysteine protease Prp [Bacillota bacterium]|nr:ribosomal-processing cysteine protease Prp [Bacillota bacterium]